MIEDGGGTTEVVTTIRSATTESVTTEVVTTIRSATTESVTTEVVTTMGILCAA